MKFKWSCRDFKESDAESLLCGLATCVSPRSSIPHSSHSLVLAHLALRNLRGEREGGEREVSKHGSRMLSGRGSRFIKSPV